MESDQYIAAPVLRLYTPEDYPVFAAWRAARGVFVPPPDMLPPHTGYVLESAGEPTAMLFAYCAVGVGVAHLDWLTGAPGKSLSAARRTGAALLLGVRETLAAMGYGVMMVHTLPALAGEAKRLGFQECSTGNIFLMALTR